MFKYVDDPYLNWADTKKEPILIERHGKPVAILADIESWERLEQGEVGKAVRLVKRIRDALDEYS